MSSSSPHPFQVSPDALRAMQACLIACTLASTEGLYVEVNTFDGPLGTVVTRRSEFNRYTVELHREGVKLWALETSDPERARKLANEQAFGIYDGER